MSHKPSEPNDYQAVSRRAFSRGMALVAGAVALRGGATGEPAPAVEPAVQQTQQLSTAAEAKVQAILSKYGDHLTDEQKVDVRRLVAQLEKTGETLRSFPLDNSNEPATIFRALLSERV